jgi:hypothetical protein
MEVGRPSGRLNPWWPAMLAGAILFLVGSVIFFVYRWVDAPTPFEASFGRVQVGMTLANVEAVLGPGKQVFDVPRHPDGPVVQGDEFYQWDSNTRGYPETILIGLKKGVVIDRYYHNLNYL